MATHDERVASFEPRKPKSQKKSAINTAISKGWPHPESFKARPSTLAYAGFYFDPTSSKNDNVTCFTCEHSLGEWTQDDDPFVEHLNVAPKCAWAIARCNVELDRQESGDFRFTSAARLPTSKVMEKARADTFKGFWIHDQVKGHTANSKKMAKAGWIFNPGDAEDSDLVTCFYCGKNLDGWEQGDDPTQEHKTRNPNCPVFTAKLDEDEDPIDEPPAAPVSAAPPVSTTSSKSRTQPVTKRGKAQTRTEIPAVSDINDTAAESDAPSQPKRGRSKPSAATSSSTQDIAPSKKAPATTSSKASRRATSRSASASRKAADEAADSEVEEIKPPRKEKEVRAPEPVSQYTVGQDTQGRKASKSRDVSVDINIVEEAPAKPSVSKKKSKKKGSKKSKSTVSESGDDLESEVMEVDAPPVIDVDATPLASDRNSLSDWNRELEAQARELHIEEEFAAIDNKRPPSKLASSIKTKLAAKVPQKSTNIEKATKVMAQDRWAYRDQADTKSVVTDMTEEMTEEEEVEKSLAEDDFDDDEDMPSPPPSRPASVAPSGVPSIVASTTVSSKTKVKVKELKNAKKGNATPKDPRHFILQQDEDMADMSTPKARPRVQPHNNDIPTRPPPLPMASFDSELKRTETVSSGPTLSRTNPSNPLLAGKSGSALQSMLDALDEPMITPTVSSYELTPEEREMTLEEWIKFNIERQMEEVRKEGRKWIEDFLEEANATREEIRAL